MLQLQKTVRGFSHQNLNQGNQVCVIHVEDFVQQRSRWKRPQNGSRRVHDVARLSCVTKTNLDDSWTSPAKSTYPLVSRARKLNREEKTNA